jgi:GNAT superfamily N-acetyltransferase
LLFCKSHYRKRGAAQIDELVVDEGYRNRGSGWERMRYGIELAEARGLDEIERSLQNSNPGIDISPGKSKVFRFMVIKLAYSPLKWPVSNPEDRLPLSTQALYDRLVTL